MPIESGNVTDINSQYKDWFLGSFVESSSFFNTSNSKLFEVKWSTKEKGFYHPTKLEPVTDKSCKSIVILISGKFRYGFLQPDSTYTNYILSTTGDFVCWTPDQLHEIEALEDSVTLTIRWYE